MWRLRPEALQDPPFRAELGEQLVQYFEVNEGTATNAIVEWESYKVATRGFCMGKTVGIRRELEKRLRKVEDQLRTLEKEMVLDSSKRKNWEECKSEHSELIERLRCHDHQKYLTRAHSEEGRAGRMLARLVQREDRGDPITSIILKDGSMRYSQAAINEAFMDYYKELYSAPRQRAEEMYDGYLDRIQLQQLTAEDSTELGGAYYSRGGWKDNQGFGK